ncbi:MAG: site-specific DNA-methyltransferase, partial [Candidatus Woesearchaeota archaeon]
RAAHPTQKPLELFKRLVEMATDEGDIVVDPFIGAGTTAMAAMQLNRNWIGIDNNKEYISLANKRINKHKKNAKLKDYC